MKLLEKIFSIKNEGERKVVCVLGVKFKFKSSVKLCERIIKRIEYVRVPGFSPVSTIHQQIQSVVHIALLHQKSFSNLRYINAGKDVVLCATGPTFDYYSPIPGAKHIGLKDAFRVERIKFDYLFHHDPSCYPDKIVPVDFVNYRGKECIKFIGNSVPFVAGESPFDNDIRFFCSANEINSQIDYLPLPDYCSIVFPAFAFALWTKPKRIYIVGADCSTGHAKGIKIEHSADATFLVGAWKKMKEFAQRYYSDVEIISINPVGLKGIFKDEYTENYLKEVSL